VVDEVLTPNCFSFVTYPLELKSQIIVTSTLRRRIARKSAKK
jgi:hypothetical protein